MYVKMGQITLPVTPTCSPGFPNLKLHILDSLTMPMKYTKFGEWYFYTTLNVFSAIAMSDRASLGFSRLSRVHHLDDKYILGTYIVFV